MSGKRLAFPLLAAAGMLLAACGGDTGEPPRDTAAAAMASAPQAASAPAAEPLTPDAATAFLPMEDEAWQYRPVAGAGDDVLVQATAKPGGEHVGGHFFLWDPESGVRTPAWETPAGRQEIVTASDGMRVAVVRTGFELPFPDWELVVRDLATGTEVQVAKSDPAAAEVPGIEAGLPLGFAPWPSLAGDRVTWAEYVPGDDGTGVRRIQLLDLATGSAVTLAQAPATAGETLTSPTLGGARVAWVHADGGGAELVVADLGGGGERSIPVDGLPFMAALTADGGHIAWDDRMTAKFAMDLESGTVVRYAGSEGWGVMVSGDTFSWAPAAAFDGTGGFYDAAEGKVHLVEREPGTVTNVAQVMGDWFGWQQLPAGRDGAAGGRFAFVRI